MTSTTRPDTGEVITQLHGTRTSWVRHDHNANRTVVLVHNRAKYDRKGNVRIPAGTVSTVTRHDLKDAWRTTVDTVSLPC